jgi:diguanylate cyclase (GGDEF)-like protein/PAS domain S-box-containing protein
LISLSVIFGGLYLFDVTLRAQSLAAREAQQARLGHALAEDALSGAVRDLRSLAEAPATQQYIDIPSTEHAAQLEALFLAFSRNQGVYDQVRLLDRHGQERVRVNYNAGQPSIAPAERLQNKAGRSYFSDTFALQRHQLFVSPLDLNIENGQIETPYKPTIRLGIPLFNSRGEKAGVLLLNFLAQELLDTVFAVTDGTHGHTDLLNSQGYWLMSGDNTDRAFSFMFGHEDTFADHFPTVWQQALGEGSGQTLSNDHLFSWQTVHALEQGVTSGSGTVQTRGASDSQHRGNDHSWLLFTHVPAAAYRADITLHRATLTGTYLAFLTAALLISFFLARYRYRERQSLRALSQSVARQRAITHSVGDGILILNAEGRLDYANPEAMRILRCENPERSAASTNFEVLELIADEKRQMIIEQGSDVSEEDALFPTCDGDRVNVAFKARPYVMDDEVQGVVLAFQDISMRKAVTEQLMYLSRHDELTGLLNRRAIMDSLNEVFQLAQRYQRPLALCLLDIDFFKHINDTYGHLGGDTVLRSLSQLLHSKMRKTDFVGRYGGEEFLVVLPETDVAGAKSWAEYFRQSVTELTVTTADHQHIPSITISCGVATTGPAVQSVERLISAADAALYRAKTSGRNRVCIHTEVNSETPSDAVAS